MSNFGKTERKIKDLFLSEKKFTYEQANYSVLKCDKPTSSKGECKTDVYVLAQDDLGNQKEFKISVKQNNADFLENKISLDRAIEILGSDAQSIIERSIAKIKKTDQQKIDIYAGTNLNLDKKNSSVNGETVINSGVANYIITIDAPNKDLNYYLSKMQPIEHFAKQQDIYFVCKALNYRANKDKWDGDRSLSVYVNWFLDQEGKLQGKLVFEKPLSVKGHSIGKNIKNLLATLQINKNNFHELNKYLHKDVRRIQ